MKIGAMLTDVTTSVFRRPFTEKYPFKRYEAPERLRGMLQWTGENCTGCGLCVKDCPASALEVIVIDKDSKRFVVTYHTDRCTFCAQCVTSCRHGCLTMSHELWELAALSREPFTVHYGGDADVAMVLAGFVEPGIEAPDEG